MHRHHHHQHQQQHHRQEKEGIVNQNGQQFSSSSVGAPFSSVFSGPLAPVGSSKLRRHVAREPLAFSRTNEPTGPLLLLSQQQQQDAPIASPIQQVSLINQTGIVQAANQKVPPTHIRVPLIEEKSGQRKRKRKHRKHGRRKNKINKLHSVPLNSESSFSLSSPPSSSSSSPSSSSPSPSSVTSYTCKHKFIDKCSWPQCNRECPRLRNPFTGK